MKHNKELRERVLKNITLTPGGCWQWALYVDPLGYGRIAIKSRPYLAHRISYEAFLGKIPDGLTIDHLCRNTSCVNPEHLEPVTNVENIRRMPSKQAKAYCLHGHLQDESNFRETVAADGHVLRRCRTCQRETSRRYQSRKRAERTPASNLSPDEYLTVLEFEHGVETFEEAEATP